MGDEVSSANYTLAVASLGEGLDALSLAIKWAKINTKGLDNTVKVLVGASDLWKVIKNAASAAKSGDSDNIAKAIGQLLDEWTQVTGGCKGNKGCQMVDGIIRVIQQVAGDITPCENSLKPAVDKFEAAAAAFKGNDPKTAVTDMADGLDTVAQALSTDSCGLKTIGDMIAKLAP